MVGQAAQQGFFPFLWIRCGLLFLLCLAERASFASINSDIRRARCPFLARAVGITSASPASNVFRRQHADVPGSRD
jgi:hypothetical protein